MPLPPSVPVVSRAHRVALLGLGTMGRRHARVLAELPGRFALVGAYDVAPVVEAPQSLRLYRSEAEAIEAADVVVVATPIESHASAVARALAAQRHVLVEKPLCAQSGEARALAARSSPAARLFVGHSERFNPVVRALARLVRADPALSIELTRVGPTTASAHGVLLNLGVHDFDLAAYLGRGEVALRAGPGPLTGQPPRCSRGDVAHVLFDSASGTTGSIYVDRTAPAKRRTIRLATERWIYEGDLLAHRLTRTERGTGRRSEVPLAHEEPLRAQASALADALDARSSATVREIADGADGARAVVLAERAASRAREEPENLSLLGSP